MLGQGALAPYAGTICAIIGAVLSAAAGLWVARNGERTRPERISLLAACGLTAVWCVLIAALGSAEPAVHLGESARNLALIAVIFHLFSADGRDESLRFTKPVVAVLILVELCQLALLIFDIRYGSNSELAELSFEVAAVLRMLQAIGALVLLHNLYGGAAMASRHVLRWIALGLAGIFSYELNLATIAYLTNETPQVLATLRGMFGGIMVVLMAFSANQRTAGLQFSPSRKVTFQTLSLLIIGSYLLVMVLVTRSLALIGGDIARTSQIVFLVLAIIAAVAFLPSDRVRGWLRVTATKHLFQHRYDYREEWLRFNRTVGRGANTTSSLHERAVKAVADITDSTAGLLLVPNEEAQLELSARWNWATLEVPAVAAEYELSALLEQHSLVVDLDEVRSGINHHGEVTHIPEWLFEAEDVWALVPLIHFD
ncbi:MAG: PEP-CTERM system histidine kinase PrsK, partial [Pseudomonadota bacterium]